MGDPRLSEYRSIYQHKETKDNVRVRRVEQSRYIVLSSTGEKTPMHQRQLKTHYRHVKIIRDKRQERFYV